MHCWKILRDQAKWNDKLLELRPPANGTKVGDVTKVGTTAAPNPESVDNNAPMERPEGRDSAKRRRSKEETASSSAAMEVLQQIHDRNKNAEGKQEQQMQEILSMKGEKIQMTQKIYELQKQDMEDQDHVRSQPPCCVG